MHNIIEATLRKIDKDDTVLTIKRVSGGDINEAFYVQTRKQEYFIKLNQFVDISFFTFEQEGLEEIRKTKTMDVPELYGIFTDEQNNVPMLWMEWIRGLKKPNTELLLGERLAAMHQTTGNAYGFHGKSYIGKLEQQNQWTNNWLSYYRDFRLGGQFVIGRQKKTITGQREKRLTTLIEKLDQWIPKYPHISLLHGDLWGGNWMVGPGGNPYLIDPSILYGDHEFDIAFTELFGGFSEQFYHAYQSVYPLSATYEDKKPLYQLYYLLVHLNMFGESYGTSVDRVLKRYVG